MVSIVCVCQLIQFRIIGVDRLRNHGITNILAEILGGITGDPTIKILKIITLNICQHVFVTFLSVKLLVIFPYIKLPADREGSVDPVGAFKMFTIQRLASKYRSIRKEKLILWMS